MHTQDTHTSNALSRLIYTQYASPFKSVDPQKHTKENQLEANPNPGQNDHHTHNLTSS